MKSKPLFAINFKPKLIDYKPSYESMCLVKTCFEELKEYFKKFGQKKKDICRSRNFGGLDARMS